MVQSDGAGAEEDQSKSQSGYRQRELHSVIAGQSIVQVHFPDRDNEIYADGESRDAGKESRQYEQAAEEFREGRNVAQPVGKTKTRHEVGVVMQAAENFVVAMHDHDDAQGKTHEKKRKWLQAFRVAQRDLRVRHQITADQITAEKRWGVKSDQQNDCVAAQLLVTFFRPLSETCKSHQSVTGLGVMSHACAERCLSWGGLCGHVLRGRSPTAGQGCIGYVNFRYFGLSDSCVTDRHLQVRDLRVRQGEGSQA